VGAIVAIVFGLFGVYVFFFYEREIYDLQVVVLASTSLVEVEDSVSEEIEIFYKQQEADNLSLFQIRLENTGNQTIREEDFARPLKLTFPSQAEIVEATIVESAPQNIGLSVVADRNVATLTPALLNSRDRIIIRFLVIDMPDSEGKHPFALDARIANVKEVKLLDAIDENPLVRTTEVAQVVAAILSIAASAVAFRSGRRHSNRTRRMV